MDFIYVGEIVNTHALKGEVKVLSSFDYKEHIFQKGFPVYIGETYEKHFISSYRKHKEFDLLLFEGTHSITQAEAYKGKHIYMQRGSISVPGYFIEDLIGLSVYEKNTYLGKIIEVEESKAHKILLLENNIRIPYVGAYVKKIDLEKKKMEVELIKGLI